MTRVKRRTFVVASAATLLSACIPGQNSPTPGAVGPTAPAAGGQTTAGQAAPAATTARTGGQTASGLGTPTSVAQAPKPAGPPQRLSIIYPNFPLLDPQVVTNGMWFDAAALLEGVVVANKDATDVLPGTAEKWDVSPDKKTYTFHLRQNAKWSNGDPVTAKDFEWTYKRMLTPKSGGAGVTLGANSWQSTIGIKGANDYLAGKLTDWSQVGVKALDDRKLEITLAAPNPDFLRQMTHPSMLPLHPPTVEKFPADWGKPENWVGNGPFVPKEWVVNASMKLAPNERYWDRGQVLLSEVNVRLNAGTDASAATIAYENGEVDLAALGVADIVRFKADPKLSKELRIISGGSVVYLALMRSQNPALEDARVRKALAVGMDRQTLARVAPNLQPGPALIPSSVPNWDDSVGVKFDLAEAKKLLADAGYPGGKSLPELKILSGSSNPLVEALADIWQKNLGITVKLDVVEAGVYVERRMAVQAPDYIGYYYGSFGQLPSWAAWTALLWGPEFTKQFSMKAADWAEYQKIQQDKGLPPAEKSAKLTAFLDERASKEALEFEKLVNQALAETDAQKQQQLFKQAAKVRQDTNLFIPVVYQDAYYAVKPTVQGLNLHPGGRAYYLKGVGNAR